MGDNRPNFIAVFTGLMAIVIKIKDIYYHQQIHRDVNIQIVTPY
jgi:hypothetical protein